MRQRRTLISAFALAAAFLLAGCQAALQVGTAIADSKQAPSVANYTVKAPVSKVFTSAVQSMTLMGKVTSSDRESGIVQGAKGNWLITATITGHSEGANVAIICRYVPSNQMDFNSREGLTAELVTKLEQSLGQKLSPM